MKVIKVMKILTTGLILAAATPFASLATAEEAPAYAISANVTLASDYVYRGISQTSEESTIQGGFDLEAANGFYAGVWASNVSFDGSVEIDLYFGYGGAITEDLTYDVGYIHYDYPNQPPLQADSNFDEIYGSLAYKGLTLGLAVSDDFFGESGDAEYVYIDYELGLPDDYTLAFHYGNQEVYVGDGYNDYSIAVSKSFADVDVALGWYDTDIKNFADAESRVVLSFSKSL